MVAPKRKSAPRKSAAAPVVKRPPVVVVPPPQRQRDTTAPVFAQYGGSAVMQTFVSPLATAVSNGASFLAAVLALALLVAVVWLLLIAGGGEETKKAAYDGAGSLFGTDSLIGTVVSDVAGSEPYTRPAIAYGALIAGVALLTLSSWPRYLGVFITFVAAGALIVLATETSDDIMLEGAPDDLRAALIACASLVLVLALRWAMSWGRLLMAGSVGGAELDPNDPGTRIKGVLADLKKMAARVRELAESERRGGAEVTRAYILPNYSEQLSDSMVATERALSGLQAVLEDDRRRIEELDPLKIAAEDKARLVEDVESRGAALASLERMVGVAREQKEAYERATRGGVVKSVKELVSCAIRYVGVILFLSFIVAVMYNMHEESRRTQAFFGEGILDIEQTREHAISKAARGILDTSAVNVRGYGGHFEVVTADIDRCAKAVGAMLTGRAVLGRAELVTRCGNMLFYFAHLARKGNPDLVTPVDGSPPSTDVWATARQLLNPIKKIQRILNDIEHLGSHMKREATTWGTAFLPYSWLLRGGTGLAGAAGLTAQTLGVVTATSDLQDTVDAAYEWAQGEEVPKNKLAGPVALACTAFLGMLGSFYGRTDMVGKFALATGAIVCGEATGYLRDAQEAEDGIPRPFGV